MICPPNDILLDFVLNRCEDQGIEEIENHLIECDSCRKNIVELERSVDDPIDKEIRKAAANNQIERYIATKSPDYPTINGFKIVRKIGQGGMGIVFEAIDEKTGDIRAIKVLHSSRHFDPASIRRFEKEKEAVALLRHDNVVRSFPCDDPTMIVMERLEGKNLAEINVPLPIEQACNIIIQAAKGLSFAHQNGIVHRDIKPSNIFITNDGTVKILDLGLIKTLTQEPGSLHTQTDHITGTLNYLSPEQILTPSKVEQRSDIYSLGCVFYFLLTGTAPFTGTTGEILTSHARDKVPSVRKFRTDIPRSLTGILNKMLEKEPSKRQQSMSEVIGAIQMPSQWSVTKYLLPLLFFVGFIFVVVFANNKFRHDKHAVPLDNITMVSLDKDIAVPPTPTERSDEPKPRSNNGDEKLGETNDEISDKDDIIRVTLEFDERLNGKLFLEKTSKMPKLFDGDIVDVPSFPNTVFRRNSDKMTNMVVDFNRFDSSNADRGLPWAHWGPVGFDLEKKRFLFPPSGPDSLKQIIFLSYTTHIPIRITFDIAEFTGEMFSLKLSSEEEKRIFECRISSHSGKAGPFSVVGRWLTGPAKSRDYHSLISEQDIHLDHPKEWTFSYPIPNEVIEDIITFFVGKNLFFDFNMSPTGSTVEVSRIEITGKKYLPHIGMGLERVTHAAVRLVDRWSLAGKAGVQKGDKILSANEKKCDTREEAWATLYNYELGKPLKLRVMRGSEEKEFVIFE